MLAENSWACFLGAVLMTTHRSHYAGRIPGLSMKSVIDRLISEQIGRGIPMEQIEEEVSSLRRKLSAEARRKSAWWLH